MPNIIETLISMLAILRVGAVFHVLMIDFSDEAVANRLDELKCRVAIVCNSGYRGSTRHLFKVKLDRANELAVNKLEKCIVLYRQQFPKPMLIEGKDVDFEEAIRTAEPQDCIPVEVNSPLFIIYTSGTTGKPKGVVQSVRSIAAAIVANHRSQLKKTESQTSYICASYAWISGIISGCFIPLFKGVTIVLHEASSDLPNVEDTYRLLTEHKIQACFLPMNIMRTFKYQDPLGEKAKTVGQFSLKMLYSGAVPGDILTLNWAENIFNIPTIQIYGTTETGVITLPDRKISSEAILSSSYPLPGLNVTILREDGSEADVEEVGEIVLKSPFPPTIASTLLNCHDQFIETYYGAHPGYFAIKDSGKLDGDGRLYVFSRADDVFKMGPYRINCTAIESVILKHEDVVDSVVITKIDHIHGNDVPIPIAFVIIKKDAKSSNETIADDLENMVHKELGYFVPIKKPLLFETLPRTLNGKFQRGLLKKLANTDVNELLLIEDEHTIIRRELHKLFTST
ncbi:Acyl-CoA synthetase short-chain member 3, mitochondrial [Chamberlinius hualienensis]